ncbi:outer membrane beta-barrel protein [Lutimonas sp.]|uniref:outer membrane beta-barrel protein n=1 Tax=Lutimonas sp. TaxID=1872403 RepID=UPI003D9B538A
MSAPQTIFLNALLWTLMLIPLWASAQMNANISRAEEENNFISLSGSYGQVIQRDAWFYGFSGEYSWRLNKLPIGIAGSFMWDQEKDITKNKVVNTFTAAVTSSYLINDRWSVGTGLGKGFMDTDNQDRNYKFTDGDWSTAIFFGYQIPLNIKSSLGISTSYEYNMSASETSFSIDLAYGFSL